MKRCLFLVIVVLICICAGPAIAGVKICLDAGAPIDSSGAILVDANALAATHTHYVRLNFIVYPWSSPGDSTLHNGMTWYQTYDSIVNSLIAKGIKVYGLICNQAVVSSNGFNTDAYTTEYTNNFASIVNHFKDRVFVYEEFNEPNNWASGTSSPTLSATYFGKELSSVYTAVKINHSTDPTWQVTLVSGPLFSSDGNASNDYMAQTYQACASFKNSYGYYPFDGIGYHLYCAQGTTDHTTIYNSLYANMNAMWSTITAYEGSGTSKKFWISEFGWRVISGYITQANQGANLTYAFGLFNVDTKIAFASWFQICDFGTNDQWGLFTATPYTDANKKQSWTSFYNFAVANPPPATTGTISGTVKDSSGVGINGATVSTTTGNYATTTNSSGVYTLSSVTAGSYTVNASAFGYGSGSSTASVSGGGTATVNFTLSTIPTLTTPSAAKASAAGTNVRLNNVIVTGVISPVGMYYVEPSSRYGGIGVVGSGLSAGDQINIVGQTATVNGECVLTNPTVQIIAHSQTIPKPVALNQLALGGGSDGYQGAAINAASMNWYASGRSTVGILATLCGKVTYANYTSGYFYLDDGSHILDGSGYAGVRVLTNGAPVPSVGETVSVTGESAAMTVSNKVARLLLARSFSDIVYPTTTNLLTNPGFETGSQSPWTAYSGGGVQSGSWFGGITAHSGTHFNGYAVDMASAPGYLYQRVPAVSGKMYYATAWSCLYWVDLSSSEVQNRIGIDPSGGTGTPSASTVWSAWDTQPTAGAVAWHQLTTNALAASNYITVYLYMYQGTGSGWHINCFDDVSCYIP